MRHALASLLVLAACFMPEPPGAACVPGQATQCWCDGVTPGVQACGPDGTYEPCVCEGTGTGGEPQGSSSATGEGSTGASSSADTTAGAGSTSEPTDSTSTSEGSSTGEAPPTECTDMDFAFWQACLALACQAALAPTCDNAAYLECFYAYGECNTACQDKA